MNNADEIRPTDILNNFLYGKLRDLGHYIGNMNSDSDMRDDLGMDSLDIIDLSLSVEMQYNIDIPDHVVEGFITPMDIANYVSQQIKQYVK